ncbi:MAG: TRAP transporter large permease subunit [Deltaproteobacteria bacterium]|nr:TRAP transporter large permease subunit [Deltaproteobacteria bacterium]
MNPEYIGVLGLCGMFLLIFAGVPVGFSMMLSGFIGYSALTVVTGGLSLLAQVPYAASANYPLSALPLFVLMGNFAFHSRMTEDAYTAAYKWLGHLPGGLAMSTIGGCAIFSAVSGSSLATMGTMTKVSLPEMLRYNYDPRLALGSLAAGGTLGILIPPSTIFIIYGLYGGVSVGRLFMAGFIPGILLACLFSSVIFLWTMVNPSIGPSGPRAGWYEKFRAMKDSWALIAVMLLVLGGIWGGIFTPTEAGSIGAFGVFLIAAMRKLLTMKNIIEALKDTAKTATMIFFLLIGAEIFGNFMALSMLPMKLAGFVNELQISPVGVVIAMLIIYIFMGCLMETASMILLTLPIFLPILNSLGVDLVWFGVLLIIVCEMGMITPPMGINVFILSGMAEGIPMYAIFKGVLPFVFAMLICMLMVIIFPKIALFLPGIMF